MTVEPGEVLKHLHWARLTHYRGAGSADADALALYEWNIELTAALQEMLGIAEVAVRHAIDTQLSDWSMTHCGDAGWIDHASALPYLSATKVFSTTRRELYRAADLSQKQRAHGHPRRGKAPNHDDLVAHIMFGTWAQMLPEKFNASWVDGQGDPVQDMVNLQARRDLWRQCLHQGFPNAASDPRGYNTGNKVRDLRKLRNKISHMDSLLYIDVADLHDRVLLALLNSISRDLRDWAKNRSRVKHLLAARPQMTL